jgi:O-antigen/teichoic acid export membrane protein
MNVYFPRDLAQDSHKAREYASYGLPVTAITSMVFYVLIILSSMALKYEAQLTRYLCISGIASTLVGAYLLPGAFLRGFELMKFDAALNSGEKMVSLSAGLILLFIWDSLYALLVGLLFGQVVRTLVSFIYLHRLVGDFPFRFSLRKSAALIGPGVPLLVAAYAATFCDNIGMAFLGKMSSRVELGYYSMAWQVASPAIMAGISLANATYPFVARKTLEAKADLKELLDKTLPLFFFFALLIACGLAVSSESLINLIFGKGYIGGSLLLAIMVFVIPSLLLKYFFGNILISHYAQKAILMILLSAAAAITVLNFLLVPQLGGIGSALAFVTADYLITFGFLTTLSYLGFFRNWSGLGKALSGGAGIFLAYWALSPLTGKGLAVAIFPLAFVLGFILVFLGNQESNKRIIDLIN